MASDDHDDPQAKVGKIFERYSEELLAYIRATLPIAKSDALDVLQITFIELLKWHDKNPDHTIDSLRAFVYRVATRHLFKYVAKCRRTASSPDAVTPFEELEIGSEAREDDVEYMGGLSLDRKMLLRAMRRLGDADQQRLVYLKFWAGLTDREIGAVFEISRGAVVHRVRTALGALRKLLEMLEEDKPGSTQTSTTILNQWLKLLKDDEQ